MKKILTALNNPKLNEKLKKEKNIEIIRKDIQYREGILEILEEEKEIDIILINENLEGNIDLFKLFEKIKIINNKIKIIILLKKENKIIENKLKELNINYIYFNNKLNNNKTKIINSNNKLNINKIIKKNNNKKEKINFNNKLVKIISNNKNKTIKNNKKTIVIVGARKAGKTLVTLILGYYLSKKNNKVLIIDADLKKQELLKATNKMNKVQYYHKINNNLFISNYNQLEKTEEKENYQYIIIDTLNTNKEILNKADIILFIINPELRKIKESYLVYQKELINKKEKIKIIINYNKKFNSISLKIVSQLFNQKIIFKIPNNILLKNIKYNFKKNKKVLENKKIKNKLKQITIKINKIIK